MRYVKPDFVVWEDEKIVNACINKCKKGVPDLQSILAQDVIPFDQLCELATAIPNMHYSEIPVKSKSLIVNQLNDNFNKLIEPLIDIYNMLDKKFNTDEWNDNTRCKLLSLDSNKGYTEMSILKNTIWINKLISKNEKLDLDLIKEINCAYNCRLYWGFGYEDKNLAIRFDANPENFEICNKGRIEEIKAQNEFVKLVCMGDYDLAYKMIEWQIDKMLGRSRSK